MNIKKVKIRNFKRLYNQDVELRPLMTLVVGGNNAGKSTLLHALATWEFCKTVLLHEKSPHALEHGFNGAGYGISIDDFTPINIPSFRYLWTNLKITTGFSLTITCYWDDNIGVEKYLTIGLSLVQERLFIKNVGSNLGPGESTPKVAYLPTFGGITDKEEWCAPAKRNKVIGQGLAGAVLRNQIMELYLGNTRYRESHKNDQGRLSNTDLQYLRENDPFELLQQALLDTFKGVLYPKRFNPDFHTHVIINFKRGSVSNNRFVPSSDYHERDIMVEGSGFLQWLSVYTFALSPTIDVLLIDEPDAHLHCSLQAQLMGHLAKIAEKKSKQVLVATHSSEVIKSTEYEKILCMENSSVRYLNNDDVKVRFLAGLGSEYFPLLESIERNKRVLFVESPSDAQLLRTFAGDRWPGNLVVWPLANKHKERTVMFQYLKDQIADLKCISLNDRDNSEYSKTQQNLAVRGMPDCISGSCQLRYRTWRRWEIESYLICKPAIVRLIMCKNPAKNEESASLDFDNFMRGMSLLFPDADYKLSERTASNAWMFDSDAKAILNPLCNEFQINKFEIAQEMHNDEIFDDVMTLIDEIVEMCL